MITFLQIRNLALIKECELELSNGLNIISGETGSGKTLLVNALSLLFGERSDKNMIRTGEIKCELCAIFSINKTLKPLITKFFTELSIEDNGSNELHIRRVITTNSSRQFVNDVPITINLLEKLGELLIDFHRPEHAWSFFKDEAVPLIIDSYGKLENLRISVKSKYHKIVEEENKLKTLQHNLPKNTEIDYLKHICNEISRASIIQNEDLEIESKYSVANNAKEVMLITEDVKQQLYESEQSVYGLLSYINKKLSELSKIDPSGANEIYEASSTLSLAAKELFLKTGKYSSRIDLNEEELKKLEERLSVINSMKKKYGGTISSILELLEKTEEKLSLYNNSTDTIIEIERNIKIAKEEYAICAKELSNARKTVAVEFTAALKKKLIVLGFTSVEITAKFAETQPSENGSDKIDLMFSANLGEKEKLIQDIASSGEQSRIILAIKTILKDLVYVPILVFDEIDANIGGEIGKEIGKELKNIGKTHQVICISHLPQVASFADIHFGVSKKEIHGRTVSNVLKLNKEERVSEIARMLGGGKSASAHAKNIVSD